MTTKKKILSISIAIVLALLVVVAVHMSDKSYQMTHGSTLQQDVEMSIEAHSFKLSNQSGDIIYEFSTLSENQGVQISVDGDSVTVIVPDTRCSCFDNDLED